MKLDDLLKRNQVPGKSEFSLEYNDLKRFFWKFKGLLKERERNNAFWASTNENLKVAYDKLDEKDNELERAYNLNRKYLDNIKEGLLLIDRDYKILNQYSRFLIELFKTKKIEGKNFIDFIYPDSVYDKEKRNELEKFLHILFHNKLADIDMVLNVNPLHDVVLKIKNANGKTEEIFVNASFTRIVEENNITYIMVIFEDKTNIVRIQEKLELEKNRYHAEIEAISAILKAGPNAFTDFIHEANKTFKFVERNINNLKKADVLNALFREIHSFKASSKYFGLIFISTYANKIEDILSQIIKNPTRILDRQLDEIKTMIKNLFHEFENIEKLNDKLITFSSSATKIQNDSRKDSVDVFFNSLKKMTQSISKELKKEVNLTIENKIVDVPFLNKMKNPIIHMIRNSIDHGIEDNFERLANNKENIGNIKLIMRSENENYLIEIIDDGRGINFDKVKKKAIEKKLIKPADKKISHVDLLNFIFSPNFSIKDKVTDISGRGYGLDVVREVIKNLKGTISVTTQENKGTKITLKIPKMRSKSTNLNF